jgi:ribonuclease VapC
LKKKKLLDSFAILAYLNKEPGYEKVKDLLKTAQYVQEQVLMNEINLGEIYYILFRKRGERQAESFINEILPNLPIHIISNTLDSIIATAKIKARYPISYADAFAVSTAVREEAAIVTGDPEFEAVEHLVIVEWILTSKESE